MREIKFRVWDKEKKCFIEEIEHEDMFIGSSGELLIDSDRIEVMQYTGLKDKNGKEIYEGYLIKHQSYIYQIIFELAGFWGKCYGYYSNGSNMKCSPTVMSTWKDCEIVGNIYENPELLK